MSPSPSPTPRPLDSTFRPSAVIFDCDGVLLDTEKAWAQVQERVFTRHGLEFGQEQQRHMMGWSARDVARELAVLSGADPQEALAEILVVEAEILQNAIDPIEGALELVWRCSRRVPTAVASNSTSGILERKLTTTGISEHVQTWVSSDDVADGKPAADMYLEAARRLDVEPQACLAVEDSPIGAIAAVRADMITVGVLGSGEGGPIPASLTVDSLLDPRLGRLLDTWGW